MSIALPWMAVPWSLLVAKDTPEAETVPRDGQGGIRTLDTLAGMPPFQGGAFNRSATCPESLSGGNLAISQWEVNVRLNR